MNRYALKSLSSWLSSTHRKPLVLRGARQVGKSTLVRNFAKKHKLTLNEVNLERNLALDKVFASLDMTLIRGELEALIGRSITEESSLLFLDEIQATPSALQALRYFYEELPDVPLIAAGSLLEFALADHNFSMPVGRIEYQYLGPMTFREYLEAIEPYMVQYLDALTPDNLIPEVAHSKLLSHYRHFLFVGGMPESIAVFKESGSLVETAKIHRSIINTYEDDFSKYSKQKDLARLQKVFRLIPRTVSQKVKYVNFSREDYARDIKAAIALLSKALVCNKIYSSHCSGIPLYADVQDFTYKLLFLDVGLMNQLCGIDWQVLQGMSDLDLINKGALAEQFVGQHLSYPSHGTDAPRLVYWLRENKAGNAEVDYVISKGPKIYPIEVKAGKSGSLRSIQQFVALKESEFAIRFDLNQPSLQIINSQVRIGNKMSDINFKLLSLPVYAISELDRIIVFLKDK